MHFIKKKANLCLPLETSFASHPFTDLLRRNLNKPLNCYNDSMNTLKYEYVILSRKINYRKESVRFYKNGDLYKTFNDSWNNGSSAQEDWQDEQKKDSESFDEFLSRSGNIVIRKLAQEGWKRSSQTWQNDELKFVRKAFQNESPKIVAPSGYQLTPTYVQVFLAKYQPGANTTSISKFLQQELHLDPHEAARAITTRILASKVSQAQGEELQDKLKNYKVEVSLKTINNNL